MLLFIRPIPWPGCADHVADQPTIAVSQDSTFYQDFTPGDRYISGMTNLLMARWSDIGDRLVAVAREFPADKYEFRPAPEVRTFAEQLRHVAFWNGYLLGVLRNEKPKGDANTLPADRYPNKSAIVKALTDSVEQVKTELAKNGAPDADSVVSFIEHSGEHYGQLVLYYRLNGLVPPASQ
jgi:DinB superfamily